MNALLEALNALLASPSAAAAFGLAVAFVYLVPEVLKGKAKVKVPALTDWFNGLKPLGRALVINGAAVAGAALTALANGGGWKEALSASLAGLGAALTAGGVNGLNSARKAEKPN